jgi:hypothetical protein
MELSSDLWRETPELRPWDEGPGAKHARCVCVRARARGNKCEDLGLTETSMVGGGDAREVSVTRAAHEGRRARTEVTMAANPDRAWPCAQVWLRNQDLP